MWAPAGRQLWREVLLSGVFKRISPQLTWTQLRGLETFVFSPQLTGGLRNSAARHSVVSEALSADMNTAGRSLPREWGSGPCLT